MSERWRTPLKFSDFKKNMDRKAPVFANINLLGACNVDCYFCLGKDINAEFKKHNQMAVPFQEWNNFQEFLTRCRDANIQRIYVTGQNTDSLIYKFLPELVDYMQGDWGFNVGLRTNGYLAPRRMEVIEKCRRSVGYSIHSLIPSVNWAIMRRKDIPDWDKIIPATPNCRVSIVLNRHNEPEFDDLLRYIAKFPNVKYIQVRRICTDTREDYLIDDVRIYEEVFEKVKKEFPLVGYFYNAEVFSMYGKEVCFWRTVKTSIDSFNYYTDGTINDEYFVIEGYMRSSETFPKKDGAPVLPTAAERLEGYWRKALPAPTKTA